MSVILKGTVSKIQENNNTGVGPGACTNITVSQYYDYIVISWTNPSDIISNGVTLSKYDHTVLVRNTNHCPENAKDGDVLYTGNSTYYTDSNVTKNTKYYYRLFVYDTNKKCNNSTSMIKEVYFYGFDPVLSNNTWDQIAKASENDAVPYTWNIGDEINVTLSGNYNETITLQIWDFKHFNKSDGSGKAGICFGMKGLMKNEDKLNITNSIAAWSTSTMKNTTIPKIISSMPASLQNVLKQVNTYANEQGGRGKSIGTLSTDKVFLPGATEIFGERILNGDQYNVESNQKQFPIFTDAASRIKKGYYQYTGETTAKAYYTRSSEYAETRIAIFVDFSGNLYYNGAAVVHGYNADVNGGICLVFNV